MKQLQKAKNEIALNRIDETHPLILDSPNSRYSHRECTKENPMPLVAANGYGKWQHPEDAVHEIHSSSDYYARLECKICGYRWDSELPE